MFSITDKTQYFQFVEKKYVSLQRQELKNVQDGFILSELSNLRHKAILEVGGGQSRVLPRLHESNELWNADKLEGLGKGPTEVKQSEDIKLVKCYLGEFNSELPSNYFDVIFSISTIEHIPGKLLNDVMNDMIRLLKPGGISIHAIDLYIGDRSDLGLAAFQNQNKRIQNYFDLVAKRSSEIGWLKLPQQEIPVVSSAKFAGNSNNTLYRWSRRSPKNRYLREIAQSVSLEWGFQKL